MVPFDPMQRTTPLLRGNTCASPRIQDEIIPTSLSGEPRKLGTIRARGPSLKRLDKTDPKGAAPSQLKTMLYYPGCKKEFAWSWTFNFSELSNFELSNLFHAHFFALFDKNIKNTNWYTEYTEKSYALRTPICLRIYYEIWMTHWKISALRAPIS